MPTNVISGKVTVKETAVGIFDVLVAIQDIDAGYSSDGGSRETRFTKERSNAEIVDTKVAYGCTRIHFPDFSRMCPNLA